MLESWLVEGKMAAGIGPGGVAPREGAGAAEPGGSAPEAIESSTIRPLDNS